MTHRLLILEWLYKADQDFGFAAIALREPAMTFYDPICTSFHQAVEKYLKAYIVAHELSFRKLHDLEKLLRMCMMHDEALISLEEACLFLNPFYVELRYADTPFVAATKHQAEEAYRFASLVQQEIRKRLHVDHEIALEEIRRENAAVDKILQKKEN
ncbi:HEPN domain-containing protein [Candidatus Gottesmanbacteria bacterium]|nr:HEPN domain-containing protein [Candidatus Gottesmanbacteria bacterium]